MRETISRLEVAVTTRGFSSPGGSGSDQGPFAASTPRGLPAILGSDSRAARFISRLFNRQANLAQNFAIARASVGAAEIISEANFDLRTCKSGYFFLRAGLADLPVTHRAVPLLLHVIAGGDVDPDVPDAPNLRIGQWTDFNRDNWIFMVTLADGSGHYIKNGISNPWKFSDGASTTALVSDAAFPTDFADEGNGESVNVAPSRRATLQGLKDLLTFFTATAQVWIAVIGGDSGNAALPDAAKWQDLPDAPHRENKDATEIRVTTSGTGFGDHGPYTANTADIKDAADANGVVLHSEGEAVLHVRWVAADSKFQINTLRDNGAEIYFANITVAKVELFFDRPITATTAELVELQRRVEMLENQPRGIVFHVRRFVEVPKGTDGDNLRLNGGTFPANFRGKQELTANPVLSLADGAETPAYTVYKGFPANYDEANSDVFQFTLVYDSNDLPDEDAPWLFDGKRDPATAEETVALATVDVVGGNSGLARLDDKATPQTLPFPYGLVSGDLAGALNGVYFVPFISSAASLASLDVMTLPNAKPPEVNNFQPNGNGYWKNVGGAAIWRIWKDGDAIKIDNLLDDEDRDFYFTSLTIQIPVAKAAELGLMEPEQDYGTTAEELFGDAQTAVLTERRIAFAAGAGDGPGEPTTTPFNQPGTRQLTAAEVAVINAAGNDGSKTRISGAITWEPGAYAGFAPEPASVAVQVGRAEVGGANPVAADFETVGTISNMLSGAERDFSFPITASAVAKGRDVRLVFTVMTEGGALAHNAFAVSDVIVSEKGNSVDRVIALAKSALSGSIALINAAITAIRKRVTQNEEDITALSQRQPLSLSATILGFLSRIGLKHDAGTEIWRYPWDGGAWFNGDADGTNGTAANPIASLVAAGTEAGATLRVSNDGPGNLLRLTTPNNEIHKTLHLRRLKSLGNNTLVWLVIPGLGAVPFLRSVVEAPADGGAHYLIDHPDGGSRGFTIRRNGLDSAVVPMMMDDSFDISLTPGPVDHTDASYVITLIREDGTKIELGTLEAPHNTLARLRFNDIAFDMVDPTDPNSKMKFWQNAGILHHQGVYISHAHLAELDLAYEKTADGAVVSTFFGQRSISPGQEYNTINGDLEILTGPFVVPDGELKIRKTDGTLEDFSGGSFASPAFRFVRVAHGAAAPTLTGGTPGKDWRGGAFETEPVAGNGGVLLGSWPAAPDYAANDYYEFRADVNTASDAAIVWVNHGKRDGAENPPTTTSGLNRAEVLGVISHADAAAEEDKRGSISFAGIRNVIAAGVAVADSALELAIVAVFTRWLPAAAAGKALRWTADGKLENVDFPEAGGGGGGAATPEVVLEAYSGNLAQSANFTALDNAIDLTQRWDELNVTSNDTSNANFPSVLLPSVSMSAVKRDYKAVAGLSDGRTHQIVISAIGVEPTGASITDLDGSFVLEGTANSITHISWRSGRAGDNLLNLEVVRWAQSGGGGTMRDDPDLHAFSYGNFDSPDTGLSD